MATAQTPSPQTADTPQPTRARRRTIRGRRTWRNIWLLAGVTALAIAGLSACGSSRQSDSAPAGETSAGGASSAGSGANGSAFPLTVATRYGEVTIKKAPQRAVALTVASADALISLGVRPIAVAADPGTLSAAFPWMVKSIKDLSNKKLVSPDGVPSAEAIAQTHPDLIVGETWLFKDKAAYDQVNEIAPTVIPDSDSLNVDWDQRLLNAAAALDKTDEAQKIISEIRAEFAKVGEQVPGIADKTYQFVRVDPNGFGFGNGSVLGLFGLKPAANQDNSQNGPPLSKENTAHLDADLLGVWAPTEQLRNGLDKDPLFQNLPAVKNNTVFYADLAVADAANSPGPMSLRWLKDKLAPTIEALG